MTGALRSADDDHQHRRPRQRAGVLALDATGERVFVVTSSKSRDRFILPAGSVEPGESRADAAAREALEEAGVVVAAHELQWLAEYCNAERRSVTHWYVAARVERVLDGAAWLEAHARDRALVPLERARALLAWRPDTEAAMAAYFERIGRRRRAGAEAAAEEAETEVMRDGMDTRVAERDGGGDDGDARTRRRGVVERGDGSERGRAP